MRAGQPFSLRYPLVEVDGAYGTLAESGNWSAPRYTSSRLSPICCNMFDDIDKETTLEWRDNYDNTEQYPSVLPTKGYYNIVNGVQGIGVALASNIPQFNLTEVNNALIKLIENPDCDFDSIYCAPDFATGGILLNADEVKESIKNGTGKSCCLRAVVDYDGDDNCLVVREIPYGVYTMTIREELTNIIENGLCPGIERFNDLTGDTPNIKIYLTKRANPAQVLKYLYKETSLQSHFGVNMTMLQDGRFPKVYGWREALLEHIQHEKDVYRRGYEFDLRKAKARLHIVEGLLIALNNIEDVIATIKASASTAAANNALCSKFGLDNEQAKAILEMKLSRLAHLEVSKVEEEQASLVSTIDGIERILNNEDVFNEQLIKGWKATIEKYGDSRRTQLMNLDFSDSDDTPIEKKQLVVHLTSHNALYAYEDTTLIASRRGRGTKVKLSKDELLTHTVKGSNYDTLLMFSSLGKVYGVMMNDIPLDQTTNLVGLLDLADGEHITAIVSDADKSQGENVIFVTRDGTVKRTPLRDYKTNRSKGMIAIKLNDGDAIKKVLIAADDNELAIATKDGYFVRFAVSAIPSTGRNTKGVRGITLHDNDKVCDAAILRAKDAEIVSVTRKGYCKKTPLSSFSIGSRANKGVIVHKLNDTDEVVAIAPIAPEHKTVSVSSTGSILKFSLNEVQSSDRNTLGTLAIKLKDSQFVTSLIVE